MSQIKDYVDRRSGTGRLYWIPMLLVIQLVALGFVCLPTMSATIGRTDTHGDTVSTCETTLKEFDYKGCKATVSLWRFNRCHIAIPDMSQNAFLIGVSYCGSGAVLFLAGYAVDIESNLDIRLIDLDSDGVDEVVCIETDESNRSGDIYRIVLDTTLTVKLQHLEIPNVIMNWESKSSDVFLTKNNELIWPGSEKPRDSAYIVYYDKVGDSIVVRVESTNK